jgi:hypothetical protein
MLKLDEYAPLGYADGYVGDDSALLMEIPPEITSCISYLAMVGENGEDHIVGTAFFLCMRIPDADRVAHTSAIYAVTALHNIQAIKAHGGTKTHLLVNGPGGGIAKMGRSVNDWICSKDKTVDIAVTGIENAKFRGEGVLDYRSIISGEEIRDERINIGDNLFITGLFINRPGHHRVIPIVRLGSIAAMPEEKIHSERWGAMDGYLIEVRSIGGLSGSPVFVELQKGRRGPRGDSPREYTAFRLIGVMHGHSDIELHKPGKQHTGLSAKVINTGIGIATPSTKIVPILNDPRFAKERQRMAEAWDKRHPITLD